MKKVFWIIALACISTILFAQSLLQLGSISFSRAPATLFKASYSLSPSFFRGVGGIAFAGQAKGLNNETILDINYISTNGDGERLKIIIKGDGFTKTVSGQLYDWEIKPILEYASYPEEAAMTLFGKLEDKQFEKEILENNGRIINLHPAFDNTLVGLRLIQADILIFDPNAIHLPTQNGQFLLGEGEEEPNLNLNEKHFKRVRNLIEQQREVGSTFASYVIGSPDSGVTYSLDGGSIEFKNSPKWLMWDEIKEIREARDFKSKVGKSWIKNSFNLQKVLEEFSIQSEQDLYDQLEASSKLYAERDKEKIEMNEELSILVSEKVRQENGINPTVYKSLQNVMNYTAVFRELKEEHPAEFEELLNQTKRLNVTPAVETPTVQRYGLLH